MAKAKKQRTSLPSNRRTNVNFTVGLIALLVGAFTFWPAPPFSQRLQQWRAAGHIFKFQDKYDIYYRDEKGDASADDILVLIHGFPTSSYDWSKVFEGLKSRFGRIIAPDMLGFGFSDKPMEHNYSIFEQADVIGALLHHLKIDKVHLLSHDYGDTVAQEILHRHANLKTETALAPKEIKTSCLLNGGVFPDIHTPRWSQKALLNPYVQRAMGYLMNSWVFARELSSTFGDNKPTNEDLDEWWAQTRHNEGQRALQRLINYIPERWQNKKRWLEALQNTPAKVHFIYGPQDPINPHPFATHFKKTIPRGTIETLPNVGHYVQWEAPNEMLDSYFKFLDGHLSS